MLLLYYILSIRFRFNRFLSGHLRLGCMARDKGHIYDASDWFKMALQIDQVTRIDQWVISYANCHVLVILIGFQAKISRRKGIRFKNNTQTSSCRYFLGPIKFASIIPWFWDDDVRGGMEIRQNPWSLPYRQRFKNKCYFLCCGVDAIDVNQEWDSSYKIISIATKD